MYSGCRSMQCSVCIKISLHSRYTHAFTTGTHSVLLRLGLPTSDGWIDIWILVVRNRMKVWEFQLSFKTIVVSCWRYFHVNIRKAWGQRRLTSVFEISYNDPMTIFIYFHGFWNRRKIFDLFAIQLDPQLRKDHSEVLIDPVW